MQFIIHWLISSIAIIISAYVLPGVHIHNFWAALATAAVLGILNAFLRPILTFLTLPLNILTFGLFTLIITTVLILLADSLVGGFKVDNFWWALIFGIVLSIVNSFLLRLAK